MNGQYQNEITDLPGLSDQHYESIFKIYKDGTHFTYNLLQQVTLPTDLDPVILQQMTVTSETPYTALSYNIYGNINMWWLICIVNDIEDPTKFIPSGTQIKVIKPQYVSEVLNTIRNQMQ